MRPHDLPSLREALRTGESFDFRFFWGHQVRSDGQLNDACFSQWWPAVFTVDGVTYASAEQYMMAGKARTFGDKDTLEKILATTEPPEAKRLGRSVVGFEDQLWRQVRFEIVVSGNFHKFRQNIALGSYLIATGGAILVEASPVDRVWGIGLASSDPAATNPELWRGENLLGFALMRARAMLLKVPAR